MKVTHPLEILINRGCPYSCNYCLNHALRRVYQGKGEYLRYRSVDKAIDMLVSLINKYRYIKEIEFFDDIFISNRTWLKQFCQKYTQRINLPFICNVVANQIDEEIVDYLSKAGCTWVNMAIETGNERLRQEVLNKKIANSDYRRAACLLKDRGIKIFAHNMVGIPYETEDTIWETINFNKQLGVDHPMCYIFYPFPGTSAYQQCKQKGWISQRKVSDLRTTSILDQPTISKEKVAYYQKIFKYQVSHPRWCPIIKVILDWKIYSILKQTERMLMCFPLIRQAIDKLKRLLHLIR